MIDKEELIDTIVALRNKLQEVYWDLEDFRKWDHDNDIPPHNDVPRLIKGTDHLVKMTFLGF